MNEHRQVHILCSGAFSIKKVAMDIFDVLKHYVYSKCWLGYYYPHHLVDTVIIVGNPHFWEKRLYDSLTGNKKIERVIAYITLEGNIRDSHKKNIEWLHNCEVVAVSHYVKKKLEEAGFSVSKVIHHGVRAYGKPKATNNRVFGYIAGYLKRKFPEYGVEAVAKADAIVRLITNLGNPVASYFDCISNQIYNERLVPDSFIADFYRNIAFYLNLSDAEGFGLTPLEALAFGTPVVAPRYPPLTEFLPSFTLWVPCTGRVWYENWGNWLDIEHHEYRAEDMLKVIERAKSMPDSTYAKLSSKCYEYAQKYDIHMVYAQFLDLL